MKPPPGGGGGGGGGGVKPPPGGGGGGGGGGMPPAGGGGGGKSDINVLLSHLGSGRADLEASDDPRLHRLRVCGGEDSPDPASDHAQGADEAGGDQHQAGDQGIHWIGARALQDVLDVQYGRDSTGIDREDHRWKHEGKRETPQCDQAESSQGEKECESDQSGVGMTVVLLDRDRQRGQVSDHPDRDHCEGVDQLHDEDASTAF